MLRAGTFVLLAAVFAVLMELRQPEAPQQYRFEAVFESSVASEARLYFDRGAGLSEADSVGEPVQPGENHIVVPLAPADYRTFRFDPINVGGTVTLRDLRITNPKGRTARTLDLEALVINQQFLRVDGESGITLRTAVGANDPYVGIDFVPPLSLRFGLADRLLSKPWSLLIRFALSVVGLVLVHKTWQQRSALALRCRAFAGRRPRSALTIVAALAAIASSYPVVFFGMSFVSPNTGTVLLYDGRPTVPGQTDLRVEEARNSDVGAMMWQHLPYTVLQARALREGALPLWNRFNSSGVTLIGQGQSMLGDPLQMLVAIAGGGTWAVDAKFVLCKALFALGIGWSVWLLTRDLGAAAMVAIVSTFVAFFNYRINHPAIFSVCYSPWVLVGWFEIWRADSRRRLGIALALWFVASGVLLSSGTVKEAYLLFAALNATGALTFIVSPLSRSQKLRRGIPVALTGVAIVAATSPLWWTFLDTLRSARTMYDLPQVFQIRRAWLIGLFDDVFYQEPSPSRSAYAPAANAFVLLGCLWAFAHARTMYRERTPLVLATCLVAAITIAFEFVPARWIQHVPFLGNVHHVGIHFSCIALVIACVLAGWAFAHARRSLASSNRWLPISLIALAWVALLAVYFRNEPAVWTEGRGFDGWLRLLPSHRFFYLQILLTAIGASTLLWVATRHAQRRPTGVWMLLAGVLAVAALLARHGQHLPNPLSQVYVRQPGPRVDVTQSSQATEFLRQATDLEPGRVIGFHHILQADFTLVYGLESINGPDALIPATYREFLDAAGLVPAHDWHVLLTLDRLPDWRSILDFMNVRFVVAAPGTAMSSDGYERTAEMDLDIHSARTAWPRAFFVSRLHIYNDLNDLIAHIREWPSGGPFAYVQAGDRHVPPVGMDVDPAAPDVVVPAHTYDLGINQTSFRIEAPGPGYAILHEAGFPENFRVEVNGSPTPSFRVNHIYKAVALPDSGRYHITFSYWPKHFTPTLLLAAAGLGLMAVLLWSLRAFRLDETARHATESSAARDTAP